MTVGEVRDRVVFLGVVVVLILIAIIVLLILWLDSGSSIVTPGCALITYTIRPDKCTTTTCPKTCVALTGPYPKWAGKAALITQDVGCLCPTNPIGGLAPYLQKLLDQALNANEVADLMREVEKLIQQDFDSSILDKLYAMLEKLKRGEKLTPVEREELEKLLRH